VWADLPKQDDSGNTYYYYVTEKTVDGFEAPVYTNNDGIESGTITVTNKKKETNGYVLPSTGGGGTFRIAGLGLALMSVSAFGVMLRKRRRRGG
jgi:LPXTG-motif cell wall-anchored protein